jgi:hypothetical protein
MISVNYELSWVTRDCLAAAVDHGVRNGEASLCLIAARRSSGKEARARPEADSKRAMRIE